MSSSGDDTLIISRALRSDQKYSTRSGNLVQDVTDKVMISSEVAFYNAAEKAVSTFDDPPGIKIISGNMGAEGVSFYSILDPFKCTGDKKMRYTKGMVLSLTDLSSYQEIIPRLNEEKDGWEKAADYCDTEISDSVSSRIDDKITYINASSESGTTNFRIAYVTRFSLHLIVSVF